MATHCEALEANRLAAEANSIAGESGRNDRWAVLAGVFSGVLSLGSVLVAAVALRDSRRAADAAVKALDEGRAIVLPSHPRIIYRLTRERDDSISGFSVTGSLTWKNYGARPALHTNFEGGVMLVPSGSPPPRVPKFQMEGSWKSLEPGEEHRMETRPLDEALLPTLFSRTIEDMYLVGLVSYRDRLEPNKVYYEQITMLAEPYVIQEPEAGSTVQGGPNLIKVEFLANAPSFLNLLSRIFADWEKKREFDRMLSRVKKMLK